MGGWLVGWFGVFCCLLIFSLGVEEGGKGKVNPLGWEGEEGEEEKNRKMGPDRPISSAAKLD